MKIGIPSSMRTDYSDRNMTPTGMGFNLTLGPHGATVRAQYTVPIGRRAIISVARTLVVERLAPTTADLVSSIVRVDSISAAYGDISYASYVKTFSTQEAYDQASGGLIINAGDIVSMLTENLCAGGSAIHTIAVAINEFDA